MQSRKFAEAFSANCALLASDGTIVAVNGNWRRFGSKNGMRMANSGIGVNYLSLSRIALGREHPLCLDLEALLAGHMALLSFCYPCHGNNTKRWFNLLGSRVSDRDGVALLAHIDITAMISDAEWSDGLVVETSRCLTRPIVVGHDSGETAAGDGGSLTSQLTSRQAQVLSLVLDGQSNMAIATELGISDSAVKKHVAVILSLVGAGNRRDLIRLLRRTSRYS